MGTSLVVKNNFRIALLVLFTLAGQGSIHTARADASGKFAVALPHASATADGEGCFFAADLMDPGARSYAEHLSQRLKKEITLCLTDNHASAAQLAAESEVDMAWITSQDYSKGLVGWRSILILRNGEGLGRVPMALFTLESADFSISDVMGSSLAYMGKFPTSLHVEAPRRALKDIGIPVDRPADTMVFDEFSDLVAALKDNRAKAGIVESETWGRECGVLEAGESLCDGLELLYYRRPRAESAFILSEAINKQIYLQLVSIHIALHFENEAAFAWVNQGQGSEFEPAEAKALAPILPEHYVSEF